MCNNEKKINMSDENKWREKKTIVMIITIRVIPLIRMAKEYD